MASPTVRQLTIANGDLGTAQTVDEMGRLIRAGAQDGAVRMTAINIIGGFAPTDRLSQLLAIREWVAAHFQFIPDPATTELLHEPVVLLRQIAETGTAKGDCDDAAILAGALAAAVGFHVGLVVIALGDPKAPFGHVWASGSPEGRCVDDRGRQLWVEFDVTRPMQSIPVGAIARRAGTLVC